jgi:hypothetical protein
MKGTRWVREELEILVIVGRPVVSNLKSSNSKSGHPKSGHPEFGHHESENPEES